MASSDGASAELGPLLEALARFVGDRRRRLLQVRTSVAERASVVEIVAAHEHRVDNRSPFVVCEAPHDTGMPGWADRAIHARAVHEHRCEQAPEIPALPAPPVAPDEVVGFALQLQQLLHAPPPETEGLVVVLAPERIAAPAAWSAVLARVIDELDGMRWIVVEAETDATRDVVRMLGDAACTVDVRTSDASRLAALERMVSGTSAAGPKGVTPPSRRDVVPPSPEQAKRGELRRELGRLVLGASLASARGQGPQAVAEARAARDLALGAGWADEALALETMLAGYLVGAGAVAEAESAFARAITSARDHGKLDKVAAAGFGLGATRTIRAEAHTALVAYAEAAVAAEQSGQPLLALEGARLAGQAALNLRMEPQAIAFFGKAVALAESGGPFVAHSSAPAAAQSLAKICRRRGLHVRAAELDALASRFGAIERAAADAPAELAVSTPGTPEAPRDRAAPSPAPETPRNLEAPTPLPSPLAAAFAEAVSAAPEVPAAGFEPTGVLTLDEIARMHWGGVIEAERDVPPDEVSRSWTRAEVERLQLAVEHALSDETSAMLSKHELAALRGESVLEQLAATFDAAASAPSEAPVRHADEPSMILGPRHAAEPSQVLGQRVRQPDEVSSSASEPPAELVAKLDRPVPGAPRAPLDPTDVIAPPAGAYETLPDVSVRPIADAPAATSDDERAAVAAALARLVAAGEGVVVLRREDIALLRQHVFAKPPGAAHHADAAADDSDRSDG